MPPQAIQLGLFVLEEAIKNEPAIAAAIRNLFAKGDPTPEDWQALRLMVALKTYRDYVPATALPADTTPAPAAAPASAPTAGNNAPPASAPAPAVVDAKVETPAAASKPTIAAAPASALMPVLVWTGQAVDPHA